MAERPNAADVLADSMRSVSCFDHEVPDCGLCRTRRAMAAADALRAAVGATGDDIVCLLPDGTLSVAEAHDECTLSMCESIAPYRTTYRIPGAAS